MGTTKSVIKEISNTRKIVPGMSKQEVIDIMGEEIIIGYERDINKTEEFTPITQKNPYRSETMQGKGKKFEISYYFTQIKQADGLISDDELTPFVFEKDKLIGKGWVFLNNLVERYHLE